MALTGGQQPLPKLGARGELPPALPDWGTATSWLGGTEIPWCASSMLSTPPSAPAPGDRREA